MSDRVNIVGHGDTVYEKSDQYFKSKLEGMPYKACLEMTGATQGTSSELIDKDLSLESLSD